MQRPEGGIPHNYIPKRDVSAMLHIDQGWARIKVASHIVWAHLLHKKHRHFVDGAFSGNGYIIRILRIDEHIGRLQ